MSPTDVHVIRQEILIVGAHVEAHRKRVGRMDPCSQRIERELSDRDDHPSHALVTKSENPLVVCDDDQLDLLIAGMPQDVEDAASVIRCDPQATSPPEEMAVFDSCVPHCGCVHDRQKLFDMVSEDLVEERLIAVHETHHRDVLLEGVVSLVLDVFVPSLNLALPESVLVRQHPVEIEQIPLGRGERRPFVQQGVRQECVPSLPDFGHDPLAVGAARDPVLHDVLREANLSDARLSDHPSTW